MADDKQKTISRIAHSFKEFVDEGIRPAEFPFYLNGSNPFRFYKRDEKFSYDVHAYMMAQRDQATGDSKKSWERTCFQWDMKQHICGVREKEANKIAQLLASRFLTVGGINPKIFFFSQRKILKTMRACGYRIIDLERDVAGILEKEAADPRHPQDVRESYQQARKSLNFLQDSRYDQRGVFEKQVAILGDEIVKEGLDPYYRHPADVPLPEDEVTRVCQKYRKTREEFDQAMYEYIKDRACREADLDEQFWIERTQCRWGLWRNTGHVRENVPKKLAFYLKTLIDDGVPPQKAVENIDIHYLFTETTALDYPKEELKEDTRKYLEKRLATAKGKDKDSLEKALKIWVATPAITPYYTPSETTESAKAETPVNPTVVGQQGNPGNGNNPGPSNNGQSR